jgi:translation elongation factor EF-Ts
MVPTADEVIKLRDQTGCGVMDCKNALEWADGDWNYAIEILKSMYQPAARNIYLHETAKEEWERKQHVRV